MNVKYAAQTPPAMVLILSLLLIFTATNPLQAQSSDPREVLQQYIADLQKHPDDNVLREKIIKLAQEMKPEPTTPPEAEKFGNRAEYVIKNAKSPADFADAAKEYEKALLIAPWVSAYYFNLGIASEKTRQLQNALRSYKLYLLAAPNAQDAREVRKQIDGLEYVLEKEESSRVLIPAGEFMKSKWHKKKFIFEKAFLNAYYIDKYEVTVDQYLKFCLETGRNMPMQPAWSTGKHPVVNVSWKDAVAYASYYGKRLPTWAEWEKAVRAGSVTQYFFGDAESELGQYAWYKDNSGDQAHPVGLKNPNPYGLYDMYGNVSEWCADSYSSDPAFGYVMLGGRWCDDAFLIRIYAYGGIGGSDYNGFRCVSSP